MVTSWKQKEFHPASTIKLAQSGVSLVFELDDKTYCVSVKRLLEVVAKHKAYCTIHEIVDLDEPSANLAQGDPLAPLTPEIRQQIKREVYEMNRGL